MVHQTPGMGTYGASWIHRGYCGAGNVQGLLGSCTGRPALVCGNAASVFADVDRAMTHVTNPLVFAVNDVGMYLPNVDHWVSLHGEKLPAWLAVRKQHWEHQVNRVFLHSAGRTCVDYTWDGLNPMLALSGYFAMQIAYLMGCAPILLCGCPGEPKRRWFEPRPRANQMDTQFGYGGGPNQNDANIQAQFCAEFDRVPDLKSCVQSMSGWTQTYLGGV